MRSEMEMIRDDTIDGVLKDIKNKWDGTSE